MAYRSGSCKSLLLKVCNCLIKVVWVPGALVKFHTQKAPLKKELAAHANQTLRHPDHVSVHLWKLFGRLVYRTVPQCAEAVLCLQIGLLVQSRVKPPVPHLPHSTFFFFLFIVGVCSEEETRTEQHSHQSSTRDYKLQLSQIVFWIVTVECSRPHSRTNIYCHYDFSTV